MIDERRAPILPGPGAVHDLRRLAAELRAGLVALEPMTEGLPLLHVRQSVALLRFVESTLKEVR